MQAAPVWIQHGKHVFIFSAAGKPIFSRYAEDNPATFEVSSILAAVAARTLQGGDPVSCIVTPCMRMAFLLRPPLFLVAVCRTSDTQHALVQLLEALYSNILLAVTSKVIDRLANRPAMDIRQFLTGTRPSFLNLLRLTNRSPVGWLDAIPCLPVSHSSRSKIVSILASASSLKPAPGAAPGSSPGGDGVLYAILMAGYQVVGWAQMRPSRGMTPLRPHDLMLLTSLVQSSAAVRQSDAWTPVCLPGVDPSGYLHAYISYLGATYVHRGRPGSLSAARPAGGSLNTSLDTSFGGSSGSAGWGRGRAMSFGGLSRSHPLVVGSPGSPASARPSSTTPLSHSLGEGPSTPGAAESGLLFSPGAQGTVSTLIPPRSGTATGPSRRKIVTPEGGKGGAGTGTPSPVAASPPAAAGSGSPTPSLVSEMASPQEAAQQPLPALSLTPSPVAGPEQPEAASEAPAAELGAPAATLSPAPAQDAASFEPSPAAPAAAPAPSEAALAEEGPKVPRHRLMLAAAAKAVAEGTVGKAALPAHWQPQPKPEQGAGAQVSTASAAGDVSAAAATPHKAGPAEPSTSPAEAARGAAAAASPGATAGASPRQGPSAAGGRVAATAASYPLAFLASPPPRRAGAAGASSAQEAAQGTLAQPDAAAAPTGASGGGEGGAASASASAGAPASGSTYDIDADPPAIFLVVVSAHTHPDHLASLAARKATMVRELHESGCFYHVLRALAGAGPTGVGDYAASVFGLPGALHLLYVWKPLRQFTMAKLPPLPLLQQRCSTEGGAAAPGRPAVQGSDGPATPWPHPARKALLRAYQRVYDELTRPSPVLRHYLTSFECDVVRQPGEPALGLGASLAGLQTTNAILIALWDAATPPGAIPAHMEKLAKVIRKDHDKLLVMTPGKF